MKKTKNEAIKAYSDAEGHTLYMFNIRLGGKPTKRRGFKSFRAADAEYTRLKRDDFEGKFDEVEMLPTVEDYFDTWYNDIYFPSVKSSTAEKTETLMQNHVLPFIGKKRLDEVTSGDAQRLTDKAALVYVKYKTVYNYAHRLFKYAVIENRLVDNPFDHVVVPKKGAKSKRDEDNFWSTDEMKRFLRYLEASVDATDNVGTYGYHKFAFFRLLAMTGLRKGEALALRLSDLSEANHSVDVNKTLVVLKGGKKTLNPPKWDSYRTVAVDDKTWGVLERWIEMLPTSSPNQLLFPNSTETNDYYGIEKPNQWLDAIIDKGTVEYTKLYRLTGNSDYKEFVSRITPHGLRHTHTTWLFENNHELTPKAVQERLGHKNIKVTLEIYNHVTAAQQQDIKDTINSRVDF